MPPEAILVFTTFPDADNARRIVRTLVEEQLIACGNLIPGIESIYRWKGNVESASEIVGILKSEQSRYAMLEARLKELHPYEVPECVAVRIADGLPAYLQWVSEAVSELSS
jgi:periplasmic divalent cation tolerance protein